MINVYYVFISQNIFSVTECLQIQYYSIKYCDALWIVRNSLKSNSSFFNELKPQRTYTDKSRKKIPIIKNENISKLQHKYVKFALKNIFKLHKKII